MSLTWMQNWRNQETIGTLLLGVSAREHVFGLVTGDHGLGACGDLLVGVLRRRQHPEPVLEDARRNLVGDLVERREGDLPPGGAHALHVAVQASAFRSRRAPRVLGRSLPLTPDAGLEQAGRVAGRVQE